jgi:S-DNA-T family DNA segregation ATPase FtsK/SpoIIIE
MRPLVLIAIDEVQRYFEHPMHGETIADLLTELVKVGPAAGYMLVLATQKPDAMTIPPKLRDNSGTRFALKVMNYQSSDAVLGAGAYSDGVGRIQAAASSQGGWDSARC